MACLRSVTHHTSGDFLSARVIVLTPIAPELEQGEARSSRIHLPYRYVYKFHHDGSNTGKILRMLWKMMQELGYEKQSKYYGTQVTYEGSKPVWHVQVYIFTPSPFEEFLRSRRSMQPSPQDATSTLEFVKLLAKLTWLLIRAIANSCME
jgi:hypothetical protein